MTPGLATGPPRSSFSTELADDGFADQRIGAVFFIDSIFSTQRYGGTELHRGFLKKKSANPSSANP